MTEKPKVEVEVALVMNESVRALVKCKDRCCANYMGAGCTLWMAVL